MWPGAKSEIAISGLLPITMVTAMVSPKARLSPKIAAPAIPGLAGLSTAIRIVSHFVAPRAYAASRWVCGVVINISVQTEVIIGVIMMASMMPAASMQGPKIGPLKKGKLPKRFFRSGKTCERRNGIIIKMPHKPRITLGIAAINSTVVFTTFRSQSGASSERNTEVPMLIGRAIMRASKEETSVP